MADDTKPAAPAEPASFVDYMDQVLGDLDTKPTPEPETKPEPEVKTPAEPEKKEPEAAAPVVPPADKIVPEEKKTEPSDADREKYHDDLFASKPGQAFKELKGELRTVKESSAAEIARLTAELETIRKNSAAPAELEQLKTQLSEREKTVQEYEQELALVRVESTSAYKEHVAKPLALVKSTAETIAKAGGLKTSDVLAALETEDAAEQDSLLTEIAGNIPERHRYALYDLVTKYQGLRSQEKFVRENAGEALRIITEREQKAEQVRIESYRKEYAEGLDATVSEIQSKVPFLRPIDGQDKWNTTLEDLNKLAKTTDFDQLTPADKARLAYQGNALPLAVQAVDYYASEVVRLQKIVAGYEAGKPDIGAGGSKLVTGSEKKDASQGGFLEALDAA